MDNQDKSRPRMVGARGWPSSIWGASFWLWLKPGSRLNYLPGKGLNFRDPWGNFMQVVEYGDIQFSKSGAVLRAMGLELAKSDEALD